jgi:hypothetical protein
MTLKYLQKNYRIYWISADVDRVHRASLRDILTNHSAPCGHVTDHCACSAAGFEANKAILFAEFFRIFSDTFLIRPHPPPAPSIRLEEWRPRRLLTRSWRQAPKITRFGVAFGLTLKLGVAGNFVCF